MRKNAVSGGRNVAVGNNIISDIASKCTVLSDHYYVDCSNAFIYSTQTHKRTDAHTHTHTQTRKYNQR